MDIEKKMRRIEKTSAIVALVVGIYLLIATIIVLSVIIENISFTIENIRELRKAGFEASARRAVRTCVLLSSIGLYMTGLSFFIAVTSHPLVADKIVCFDYEALKVRKQRHIWLLVASCSCFLVICIVLEALCLAYIEELSEKYTSAECRKCDDIKTEEGNATES